jgi:anti-sigma factor RsiW
MTCFTCDQSLSAYIDDELDAAGRREVEGHLAECERCRKEFEQHVAVWEAAMDRPPAAAPAGLWDGIEAVLGQRGRAPAAAIDELGLIVRGLAEEVRDLRQEIAELRRQTPAGPEAGQEESAVRERIRSRPELSIWTEPGVGRRRAAGERS